MNLHSKLKILVAKLFKAEKLYSSMKNTAEAAHSNSLKNSKSNKLSFQSSVLLEYANEVRSTEWYKVHNEYRVKLNDILSEHPVNKLGNNLNRVWQSFITEFKQAELELINIKKIAEESISKEEYVQLLKLSADLVRKKARLQALKVISDELTLLISVEKRNEGINLTSHTQINSPSIVGSAKVSSAKVSSEKVSSAKEINKNTIPDNSLIDGVKSNIIPLKRRVI